MKFGKSILLMSCAVGAFLGLGVTALAQEQQQQSRNESSSSIGEVVVTAEKRAVSIQDVPVAVTAFTAEQREETGIVSAAQQLAFTPGANFDGTDGACCGRVFIRGVGADIIAAGTVLGLDPGVAVYQNGFYVPQVEYIGGSPLALERVEILRGPQGTLYGRNSIGGALNSISRRPDDELTIDAIGSLTSYDRWSFEGRVSGPITDNLRASFRMQTIDQREGWYTNAAGPDEGGVYDGWNAEAQLEWEVGTTYEGWFRWLSLSYLADIRGSAGLDQPPTLTAETLNSGGLPNSLYGYENFYIRDGRTFATNRYSAIDTDKYHQVVTHQTLHFDAFDIKYIGGLVEYDSYYNGDDDGTANMDFDYPRQFSDIISPGAFPYIDPTLSPYYNTFDVLPNDGTPLGYDPQNPYGSPGVTLATIPWHNDRLLRQLAKFNGWSHELNFSSTTDGPLQWLAGLYYYQESAGRTSPRWYLDNGAVLGTDNYQVIDSFQHIDTTSSGAFMQLDYDFTETMRATFGLRYTRDTKEGLEGLLVNLILPYMIPDPANYNFGTDGLPGTADDYLGPYAGFDTVYGTADDAFFPLTLIVPYCGALTCGTGPRGTGSREVEDSWNATTGTLGLQWTPNEDTLVYGRYSRGYKAGGFNLGFATSDPIVDAEYINAYEVGWKQTYDHFQFAAAAYYNIYENKQVNTTEVIVDPGTGSQLSLVALANVAESEQYGLELETMWKPSENLMIMANYSYIHSEITDDGGLFFDTSDPFALQPGAQPVQTLPDGTVLQTLNGNRLDSVPEHKFGINATYTWFLENDQTVSLSGTFNYRDSIYSSFFNTPMFEAEAGSYTDMRALWRYSENVTLIGSVQNVFDQDFETNFSTSTPASGNLRTVSLRPPRVVSVELQLHW